MVNFDLEIKRIQPISAKEMELNRYEIDDNIKKSIILYNSAIGEIKKDNLDLAISDLKKALSYNQGFSEVIKLIGLCYVKRKEFKKAKKIFKKLIKYGFYSEIASEYIESLEIKRYMLDNIQNIENIRYSHNSKRKNVVSVRRSMGKVIVGVLTAIITIGVVGGNYLYPSSLQKVFGNFLPSIQGTIEKFYLDNKKASLEEKVDEDSKVYEISVDEDRIAQKEDETAKKNLENITLELDKVKNKENILNMLKDAEDLVNNGNYEKAANILISMKSMEFDDETKSKFDELWQEVKVKGVWPIYNDGNKLYKQKKYSEALPKLKIVSKIDPNLDIMPWALYQIGTCYKESDDKVNALTYFNQVKDNYPKSNYASYAESSIKEMGN